MSTERGQAFLKTLAPHATFFEVLFDTAAESVWAEFVSAVLRSLGKECARDFYFDREVGSTLQA